MNVDTLLAGPRGRRLAAEVANQGHYAWCDPQWYDDLWEERRRRDPGAFSVATYNSTLPPHPPLPPPKKDFSEIARIGESELMWRLADTVSRAMYWQPPDDEDQMLARPEVRQALVPIAEQILRCDAAQWWDTPMDPGRQCYVEWLDDVPNGPARLEGISEAAQAWRSRAVEQEERAKSRPEDPTANYSAEWWSMPDFAVRVTTSRALPWLGAIGLMLNEDAPNWEHARVWPLSASPDARIYEITGPESWAALVERYPFDVTLSRRHDWWRATGRAGSWFIPDWQAVAADFDGVHLTVLGYLTTAGRSIELSIVDGATVLAGWDPDDTYWLNDVLRLSPDKPPVEWRLREPDDGGGKFFIITGSGPNMTYRVNEEMTLVPDLPPAEWRPERQHD